MPRGHEHDPLYSLSIRNMVFQTYTQLYISGVKGDHHYIQTRHNDLFSHYNLILRKLKEKMPRKALVNTKRIMCSYPLGIPQYSLNLTYSIWPPYR